MKGHIGDRCYQDVSTLAASLVGTGVSQQPSWAHVVRGACAVPQHQLLLIPLAPPLPMLHTLVGKMTVSVNAEALLLAKSNLIKHGKQAVDKTASWWFVAYKTAKAGGDQLVVSNGEKEVGKFLSEYQVMDDDENMFEDQLVIENRNTENDEENVDFVNNEDAMMMKVAIKIIS